jgi:hypothetical protein
MYSGSVPGELGRCFHASKRPICDRLVANKKVKSNDAPIVLESPVAICALRQAAFVR